jgi:hypothetical protein
MSAAQHRFSITAEAAVVAARMLCRAEGPPILGLLGYHFSYLFQKETSHEDKNLFELFDNGFAVRVGVRF